MQQAQENIYNNMSKFQIATRPGHRSSESLYVIRSILELLQKKKKACIATMWDLQHYFDSVALIDCLGELYESQIKEKLYRLVFRMNENIRIAVITPIGRMEFTDQYMGIEKELQKVEF